MADVINVVFCGSVDFGKSTMMGHMLKLLGYLDEREFEKVCIDAKKNGMEKWKFAYILDVLDEERARGKTHDYVITEFDTNIDRMVEKNVNIPEWLKQQPYCNRKINFIDTPGHKHFVMHMLEGSCDADVAVLLCSLKPGEFEAGMNGQTLEHLYILRGLGIKQLVIVFNKMDIISWDKNEMDNKYNELKNIIKKLKFNDVRIVGTSAWEGINLIDDYTDFGPNLLKLILDSKKRDQEPIIEIKKNRIAAQLIFLEGNYSIVTAGFNAILHNKKDFFDIEIDKIKDKKFVKKGDLATVIITLKTERTINSLSKNIILRKDDTTIAVGIVTPIEK
ncbi:MAG: translation elongation factor EF-1 subunit alpha [Terrestrivirus sp.]|uniref:Translation elongation factor EF-1 subunit alpha n=1 Tax=Terrestrivirus sp. TaxID=2487775 RepID=A0A3G4ZN03_9VIRU|nr:MAG: translation elongation factor EF-1 subunit alpha [Terrestrivirus sp.]